METDERLPTTERLARALEARGNPGLAAMIAKARDGWYDDFKSDWPDPTRRLARDLNRLGEVELAERAMGGEFDCTEQEARQWMMSAEGREAARRFHEFAPFARVRQSGAE